MKKVLGIVPLAMLLLGAPALSGELSLDRNKVHIGSGVICDTHEEVQRFVNLMASKDAGGALQTVNREKENPLACGMATVAFRAGKDHGEVRNGKGCIQNSRNRSDCGHRERFLAHDRAQAHAIHGNSAARS